MAAAQERVSFPDDAAAETEVDKDAAAAKESDEVSDSDPELQAEIEYAKQHGSEPSAIPTRQRLKLARKIKAAEDASRQINGVVQVPRSQKNLRKSRAGKRKGGFSKVGHSGKWNENLLDEEPEFLDNKDPNYDSETLDENVRLVESVPKLDIGEYEKYALSILNELFRNYDVKNAVECVEELNLTKRARSALVRTLITVAMDQLKPSSRELISELLAELCATKNHVLEPAEVAKGFEEFFQFDLPDLAVDYVDAREITGNFVARAIADEALPPTTFLQQIKDVMQIWPSRELVQQSINQAELKLEAKNRLDSIWCVGGGTRPVRYLIRKIKQLLREYLVSGDKAEAARCVHELEVPHFSHEVVFQAGVIVINSMHERTAREMTDLMEYLYKNDELTNNTLITGFDRLYDALPDMVFDMPSAYSMLERWLSFLRNLQFFPDEIVRKVPQRGRKRIVSEGHGGKLKILDSPPNAPGDDS